jgi:radical SAM protein with 4Fe4S-binding SPASM domain
MNTVQEDKISAQSDESKFFYFQWHITNRCNFRCKHCYQVDYLDTSELSFNDLKNITLHICSTMKKWNKQADISITGGEPFIRKDLFSFLEFLNSLDEIARIDLLSNGTLITNQVAEKLKEFSKITRIQVSLDGATAETHDKIRGIGAFDKAIKGIRILNSCGFDVKIMFTLQRLNMHEVRNLIDLALKENISGLTIERLVPTGSAHDLSDATLRPDELRSVFQTISDRADAEFIRGSKLRILKYRPLWINIDPCRAKPESNTTTYRELGASCSIGLDGLCILPDATVLACRRLPIPIGNLKIDTIEKIWYQSDLLWNIRNKKNLKGKCYSCEYIPRCGGCRAMAYAVTGDYLAEDPQCWK